MLMILILFLMCLHDLSVLEREIIAIEENYLWLMAKNSSLDIAKSELMLMGFS